jgi:rhodanese-related sulfurtransferase/rubrerythrin
MEEEMRWKQFLTPVKSFTAKEAKDRIRNTSSDQITILDVRQPGEYEAGHIPGAKLIPLPELTERLVEIEPNKTTLVYCAVGGRSRVAAQILAGKDFQDVINLKGGFGAWGSDEGGVAILGEEQGLELFSGDEPPQKILAVAYSLEEGLRQFYLDAAGKVSNPEATKLFQQLSQIEVKHQEHIFEEYTRIADGKVSRKAFENEIVAEVLEGGLTTEQYAKLFMADMESVPDIISLAMSIEAQALDLYTRAALRNNQEASKAALLQIADEEKAHLSRLGELMDSVVAGGGV